MRRSDWLFLFVLVLTVAAVAGALYFSETEAERARRLETGTTQTAEGPSIGGPFTLVDQNGTTVTENDLLGKWTVIYFGYTFCPDVCPITLTNMGDAINSLGATGARVVPIFITVDPKRDTVEALQEYAQHFHPRMRFLTGSEEDVARAAKAYRVYRSVRAADGEQSYLVDHTSIVYVMGPDGKFVASMNHATSAEEMARRLRRFL